MDIDAEGGDTASIALYDYRLSTSLPFVLMDTELNWNDCRYRSDDAYFVETWPAEDTNNRLLWYGAFCIPEK